ncbi:retinol-binding protein pinta-like [Cydia strobilella]|uniref:retinol-binding protein pinta-like n=1 Tax=Cydia strobilella TaxID=1100964 RepID=UPI0030049DCF
MSVRPLPPLLAEKARKELNEDPQRLPNDLQHIKDWIAKQPHLKARTDDQWLTTFLRACKFSLERVKEKIDLYYSVRTTAPDFFQLTPKNPRFWEILETGSFLPLPQVAAPGSPKVSIIRPGRYDPDKFTISEVLSVSNTIEKIMYLEDDDAVVSGVMAVIDLEGVTMGHFLQMTPLQMKKITVVGQDATPFRMKGVHYLNTPTGFETIFNAMKALLNEKNKSRLYVHNKNYEAMYEHIPKHMLTAEYGGNAGTEKDITDYWKKKVQEYSEWLEEDMQYRTNESKRAGKPKTAESMFGAEGSFRQLQFD